MSILLTLLIFAALAFLDLPHLIRNKKEYRRDLYVYAVMMMAGLVLCIMAVQHLYLPVWLEE